MKRNHAAFFVNPSYGHVVPTLGIAIELVRRGWRVSYAVPAGFAPLIEHVGARAFIFEPMETREAIWHSIHKRDGSYDFADNNLWSRMKELRAKRTAHSLCQLTTLYENDRPDVLVHDNDALDRSGVEIASRFDIPAVRHVPHILDPESRDSFPGEQLIIISLPKFMFDTPELFGEQFEFVGFIPEGRRQLYSPWKSDGNGQVIHVCPSTGMYPQYEFLTTVMSALSSIPQRVVISITGAFDPLTLVDEKFFSNLPPNFSLNRSSSNLHVLEHSCLFIGQGGPGSTMEALYSGVPALLIPPSQIHEPIAHKIKQLGLGTLVHWAEASPETIGRATAALINDRVIAESVKNVQREMRQERGAELAANLICHSIQPDK